MSQPGIQASVWPPSTTAQAAVQSHRYEAAGNTFLYRSARQQVTAHGVFARLEQPLENRYGSQDSFHRLVSSELARARACGIENPIVVGAIPFDRQQPAQLHIPLQSRVERLAGEHSPGRATPWVSEVAPEATAGVKIRSIQSSPDKARFCQGVQQAVANFDLSDIRKAVLSRILDVELEQPVDAQVLFRRLQAQNPSGHHFLLPLADGSCFLGASPELLVSKQGEQLISNPLAGSAARQLCADADQRISQSLLGSGKDSYEHQLVIEDIRQLLEPLCESLQVPERPSLMSTAAMWHLSTLIEGRLRDPFTSALQLAGLLHPTPAVCGVPTRLAHKLINLIEPFERDLFAGTVGWCDDQGNGEWVVSIRCGRVYPDRIRLFAGCGIVSDSDPESEWLETEAKLQTMLRVLLPGSAQ